MTETVRTGLRWSMVRFIDRLRGRFVVLLALLLIPPTVYGINLAIDAYDRQSERARATVRQLAVLAADQERNFFVSTERLLGFLATSPLLGRTDALTCNRALREALSRFPNYANVYRTDAQGNVECSAIEAGVNQSVADREWFQRVRTELRPVIGAYQLGSISGLPVVVNAIPIEGEGGQFRGTFAASIRLDRLEGVARENGLPQGGVLYLIDRQGNVLTHGPSGTDDGPGSLAGLPSAETLARATAGDMRDFDADGRDGVRRVYAATPVGPGGVTMLFGLPAVTALDWVQRDLFLRVAGLALMWLAVLIGALAATDLLVTRHVDALSRAARAFSAGDFSVRPQLRAAPAEVRELGRTFSAMAERIEGREHELKASLAEKEVLLREIHHRVKNNLQMVTSLLSLQLRSIRADSARRAVADVQTRIRALALVHRHLYEGSDVAKVDIRLFMAELCQLVRDAAGPNADSVSLEVDAPPLVVPSDRAVPLALFVTEALSNSFKHAFPHGRPGRIRVTIEPGEDASRVVIADDGIGIAAPATDAPVGLGLSLMRAFAKQVGGTIETSGPPGTVTTLVFRAGHLNERQEPPIAHPVRESSLVFGQSTASERARSLKVIGGARSTTSPSSATG